MKKYDKAEISAKNEAREIQSHENYRYKDQAFYGKRQKQKREHGRVPQVKGNHRTEVPGRTPSMEQVLETFSASKDIVTIVINTSINSSEMNPGYLIPLDSDVDDIQNGANLTEDIIYGSDWICMMSAITDGDFEVAA